MIAQGNKIGMLFFNSSCRGTIAVVDATVNSDLWHYRLGHMSEKWMRMLYSDGKLQGLKAVDHSLCEGCIFGKQKNVSFSKVGREPKTKKLEFVHTDVRKTFNRYIPRLLLEGMGLFFQT